MTRHHRSIRIFESTVGGAWHAERKPQGWVVDLLDPDACENAEYRREFPDDEKLREWVERRRLREVAA